MLRFLRRPERPERRIAPGDAPEVVEPSVPGLVGREAASAAGPVQVDYGLLDRVDLAAAARGAARQRLEELERLVRRELSVRLQLPVSGRPALEEAVAYLTGHHDDYGWVRPALPESHRLEQTDVVSLPVLERALGILERSDRVFWGFSVERLVERVVRAPDEEPQVERYGEITSPAEASGEVEPPVLGLGSVDESVAERHVYTRRELWHLTFLAVIFFTLYLIADIFDGIARWLRKKFTIRIGFFKLRLGKYLAWPFRQLAKLFRRWGRRMERRAMASEPKQPYAQETFERDPKPDPEYDGDKLIEEATPTAYDTFDTDEAVEESRRMLDEVESETLQGDRDWHLSSPYYGGSAGVSFVMAATTVVEAVRSAAARDADLAAWLRRYGEVREARRLLSEWDRMVDGLAGGGGLLEDAERELSARDEVLWRRITEVPFPQPGETLAAYYERLSAQMEELRASGSSGQRQDGDRAC